MRPTQRLGVVEQESQVWGRKRILTVSKSLVLVLKPPGSSSSEFLPGYSVWGFDWSRHLKEL